MKKIPINYLTTHHVASIDYLTTHQLLEFVYPSITFYKVDLKFPFVAWDLSKTMGWSGPVVLERHRGQRARLLRLFKKKHTTWFDLPIKTQRDLAYQLLKWLTKGVRPIKRTRSLSIQPMC
jgi:hypothetical protein